MALNQKKLSDIQENLKGKKIAVVGDLMLDSYFWGDVTRISPEAPVPVIEIDNEFFRFGGAANVAYNIVKLGGIPYPVGVIGDDTDGQKFNELVLDAGIMGEGIFTDKSRPTTAKTRVIARSQHIVRIDRESKTDIVAETEAKIFSFISDNIQSLDAIILQDYNKGVLTKNIISKIIDLANRHEKIITVDPKFSNFFEYKNATVFKPNKKETEDALGLKLKSMKMIEDAGNKLLEQLNAQYVLITLGKDGSALFGNGKEVSIIPTVARKVSDVSGAGDTVISTLTMALTAGADIETATYLANFAGGLVCEEVGIVPIEKEHLFKSIEKRS